MAKPVSLGNRRVSIRYRCAPATIGKVHAVDDQEYQLACILDLSLHGIGMQLARPVEAGATLVVSIRSNNGTKTFHLTARVMHSSEVPHDEWYIGCELLLQLTPEELDQLL